MKFLFDFFPILLFFVAYHWYGIFIATAVAIIASFFQVGFFWFKHRRVENMHVVTLILITVLGGATLILQDEIFIKWKPSVVNWAFALAFFMSQFIGKKPLIQRMMETQIKLSSPKIWHYLNMGWSLFFLVLGIVNLYVAFNFDTTTWVNFKLFGIMGLTFIFVILQAIYLAQYIEEEPSESKESQ
ncbi:MAG: septation protein A [Pseudomonadota bacterium]|nr:septation protein A [Pseudomonadota bacterium]